MKKNKILVAGLILLFTGLLLSVVTSSGKYPFMTTLHFIRALFIGIGMVLTIYGEKRQKLDENAV
jgi:uncharacterized membrane protein